MSKRLRILFITRKYPPSIGGMQRLSYKFVAHMRTHADVHAITWGRSQLFLPWFLLYALVQSLFLARNVNVLHAGDPLVAPVVWLLGLLYRKPTVVNVHGLDLTFDFPGYQTLMPWLLRHFTRVVCNSRATYEEALMRGLSPKRCRLIYPGVEMPEALPGRAVARTYAEVRLGEPLAGRQVWLTVGRLVPRKGVAWFCEQVLPELKASDRFVYLVAGDGPEASRIRTLVDELRLTSCVHLLGRVSDLELTYLYTGADMFIMPNIPQPHDHEGFGLVAIEAASYGLPVIAAQLEGIQDAVIQEASGYLLPPRDAQAWAAFLRRCLAEPHLLEDVRLRAQEAVVKIFGWDKVVRLYLAMFYEALSEWKQNRSNNAHTHTG